MEAIIFEIDDYVIELRDDNLSIFKNGTEYYLLPPLVRLPIKEFRNALSTASMLRKQ